MPGIVWIIASILLLSTTVNAQDARPGARVQQSAPPAQQAPDANTIFQGLASMEQRLVLAEKCEYATSVSRQAMRSLLAIQVAEFKTMLDPSMRASVDSNLGQVRSSTLQSVTASGCKTPNGQDYAERKEVEANLRNASARMVVYLDVLGGPTWGGALDFVYEESQQIDKDVARARESMGANYKQLSDPLASFAERMLPLVCRERKLSSAKCTAVPADLEPARPLMLAMLTQTEAFGKALIAERESQKNLVRKALKGPAENYFGLNDQCRLQGLVINMGQARKRSRVQQGGVIASTSELAVAKVERVGQPGAEAWALLYRSINEFDSSPAWTTVAASGGEWSYEDALLAVELPAEVPNLDNNLRERLAALKVKLAPAAYEEFTRSLKQQDSDLRFDAFVMNGSRNAIEGKGKVTLSPCTDRF